MRTKKINGKSIHLNNPELIELALPGKLHSLQTPYTQTDLTGCDVKMVNQIISVYNSVYNFLVYPLNDLEVPCKYANIGLVIINQCKPLNRSMVNTKDGLLIKIGKKKYIHFIKRTWYIVTMDTFEPFVFPAEERIGLKEYAWIKNAFQKKTHPHKFYKEFMPDLYKVCKGNIPRLQHILQTWFTNPVQYTPFKQPSGMLIDMNAHKDYQLVIYPSHAITVQDDTAVVATFDADNNPTLEPATIQYTVYDFFVINSSEQSVSSARKSPMVQSRYDGTIYKTVTYISALFNGDMAAAKYRLFIKGSVIFLELNNSVYVVNMGDTLPPKLLATNTAIAGFKDNDLYLTTREVIDGFDKETEFAYSSDTQQVEPCGIRYTLKDKK